MTPEDSKMLEHADWEAEIGKRIAELDSGQAKTTSWTEVRRRNLAKLPHAQ